MTGDQERWQPLGSRERLLLGALVVLTLGLRLVGLGSVPPGVRFDELVNVQMADHIYAGEWPIYFREAWGHEPLYHYFQAAGMYLLGKTVLGVRVTSALFGALGVLTAYLAFRVLFDPAVAAMAALFLTTSFWSLMYSRFGLRHISLPPWIGLSACCFWLGLQAPLERRGRVVLWFALGGLCLGAALHTYFAGRVVPLVYAGFALYLLLFHRQALRGRWPGLLLFYALPALLIAPMALYLRQHPELEQRLGQVGGELFTALWRGDLAPLLRAVTGTLRMFSLQGDPEWLYNISGRPVFDPVTSILFYGGLLLSFWRWRDARRAFVLLWLALGIAPAMLSWPPGSLGHAIVAQPVTFAFPALATVGVWRWAAREQAAWVRRGARALVIAAVLLFVLLNGYDYYLRWPKADEVRREYQAPVTQIARYVQALDDPVPAAVSAPYVDYWNPWSKRNFDLYVRRDDVRVRWFDGTQGFLFPSGENPLFFLPDPLLLRSELDPDLRALLVAGSSRVEVNLRSSAEPSFELYRLVDRQPLERLLESVSFAPLWASPEGAYVPGESEAQRQALSPAVDFGHRLSLLGYAYDAPQGAGGAPWRISTYWRVLSSQSDPLAVFVHVLDDANEVRAGWDGLYVSTESWAEGDVFLHLHTLVLPSELSTGTYRVELGVYSPVTLERLPLSVPGEAETAPQGRALLAPLAIP